MTDRVTGTVIDVHTFGGTVRLADGRLVAANLADVNRHRGAYMRALHQRKPLTFDLDGRVVTMVATAPDESIVPTADEPVLTDAQLEAQIAAYLKETEAWAPSDEPQPFERHLFRKRARAKQFRGDASS